MDILGGAGICRGEANFMGNAYMSMPVAITVEGANIMTRSFQIIGQGLTRCHPHILPLMESLQTSEDKEAPKKFFSQLGKVAGHFVSNLGLSWVRGLGATLSTATRSSNAYKDGDKLIAYHEAQLLRLSANFAYTADLALLLGGRLKFEELLMGRLSDAMGAIFLGYSTLHHFSRNRNIDGLNALAESAMLQLETEAQTALREASENFPKLMGGVGGGGWLVAAGVAPLGELMRPYRPPSDDLTKEVSRLLTTPSAVHKMFAENVYSSDPSTRVAALINAMPVCLEADAVLMACKKDKRQPTEKEAKLLAEAEALRDKLIQVDVHEQLGELETGNKGYVRPALTSTQQRLDASGTANFGAAVSAAASA
jgi:hypothetical protein